ncbi:MAG: Nif11 family protein [Myxococcales bacterium]|nr:Nif11 family protein [Myxococcales bacterium]
MSVENVLRLLEMVTADKQVRADFESIGDALEQFKPEGLRAMVEFGAKKGLTFTVDDIKETRDAWAELDTSGDELSEDDLAAVAGGASGFSGALSSWSPKQTERLGAISQLSSAGYRGMSF